MAVWASDWPINKVKAQTEGGGGYSTTFYSGRLCPEVQPLTLLYTIFCRKRYPFHIPSIDKCYPFHIPCLEIASLLTAVNALSFK